MSLRSFLGLEQSDFIRRKTVTFGDASAVTPSRLASIEIAPREPNQWPTTATIAANSASAGNTIRLPSRKSNIVRLTCSLQSAGLSRFSVPSPGVMNNMRDGSDTRAVCQVLCGITT